MGMGTPAVGNAVPVATQSGQVVGPEGVYTGGQLFGSQVTGYVPHPTAQEAAAMQIGEFEGMLLLIGGLLVSPLLAASLGGLFGLFFGDSSHGHARGGSIFFGLTWKTTVGAAAIGFALIYVAFNWVHGS